MSISKCRFAAVALFWSPVAARAAHSPMGDKTTEIRDGRSQYDRPWLPEGVRAVNAITSRYRAPSRH